ncbi:unnamed protein product [Gongylonema pulchrum]|uniref:TRAF-type domain-containing protein n=1 Tax=Gongylonema pulchrum TaxID=637853 RepID=A0A183DK68_9BILA|nr:unnamed protein product [Gongylonema pulchrum]
MFDGDGHRASGRAVAFRSEISGLLSCRSHTSRCSSDVDADGVPLIYRCRLLYRCDERRPAVEGLSELHLLNHAMSDCPVELDRDRRCTLGESRCSMDFELTCRSTDDFDWPFMAELNKEQDEEEELSFTETAKFCGAPKLLSAPALALLLLRASFNSWSIWSADRTVLTFRTSITSIQVFQKNFCASSPMRIPVHLHIYFGSFINF